jgi:site-specific recombinase XerD
VSGEERQTAFGVKGNSKGTGKCEYNNLIVLKQKMQFYLNKSRSNNTIVKYNNLFKKWQTFCIKYKMVETPASEADVALFITHLLDTKVGYQSVFSTVYAIKWHSEIKGFKFDVNEPRIKNLLEAAKRMPRNKVVKKDAIPMDILKQLCETFGGTKDLADLRDLAMMLLSFAGCLRFDEVSSIRTENLTFSDEYLKIHIGKSKTDQYRQGDCVYISVINSYCCPVKWLKLYLKEAGNKVSEEGYIFRPIYRSKTKCMLINKDKKLSYTQARKCLLAKLKCIPGAENFNFGLHSFRAGGATAAANSNVNERCLMRHGRWRQATSKDRYVNDSIVKKLAVTRAMGF